jgi:hypothetical protein
MDHHKRIPAFFVYFEKFAVLFFLGVRWAFVHADSTLFLSYYLDRIWAQLFGKL